ncbi:tyrosine-type recombinase/integrase [Rhizobium sp.]
MSRKKRPSSFSLPDNVHRIEAKGKEYFYHQVSRGTKAAGQRTRLPDNPHSPAFWQKYVELEGSGIYEAAELTVSTAVDSFMAHIRQRGTLVAGTIDQYERGTNIAKKAWGSLPLKGLKPSHVQRAMTNMATRPGAANNFLGAMRAFSAFCEVNDISERSLVKGVKPYKQSNGHKPWTPAQIEIAFEKLKGVIRRGVILYMYTGMRGSDAVKLGWTDIDEGGFSITTQKRQRDVYCPIVPELAKEMETWEKRPGPFLYQEGGRGHGRRYTRKLFSRHFKDARDQIPELKSATLHGLRCTAVIRLRREGLSIGQIQDIVGMSLAMIERYCRFADKKTSGKAALLSLERTARERELQNSAKLQNQNGAKSDG